MKKIFTYVLVILISMFAFMVNTSAEEIDNILNNENEIVEVTSTTDNETSDLEDEKIIEETVIDIENNAVDNLDNDESETPSFVENSCEQEYTLNTNNYEVTFTHDGYSFNITGGSTILLSQLNQELNINILLSDVYEIFTSDDTILSINRVIDSNDYAIKSLRSFNTEESLVIRTVSGDEYIITVTDPVGDTPEHNKDIEDNGDGTYIISLDVTGDSIPEVDTASNVNIIIVYDTSQSMSTSAGSSSYSRGDQAEAVVYNFINSIATYQDSDNPSNIEMALITFDATGNTRSGLTTNLASILAYFDPNGTDGNTNLSYGTLGTNWQAALHLAYGIIENSDHDKTYVIMVTDGAPTASEDTSRIVAPTSSLAVLSGYYDSALPYAKLIQGDTNTTFYGIYIYGNEADLLDDLMYNSFKADGEEREISEDTDTTAPNYFNAAETTFLQNAIDQIQGEVIAAMGISSVSISDGTTSSVGGENGASSAVHLLVVDEDSYQYWISMEVTPVTGQTNTYINNTTGNTITFTEENGSYVGRWTDKNGEHSITGTITTDDETGKITFMMEWTDEGNGLHSEAPTHATLVTDENGNDSVDWDLSSHGVLYNGVTYTITFRVWPSQYTLDLIADLKNHPEHYDDLPQNVKDYLLKEDNGDYTLLTNTVARLSFVDTRPGGTQDGGDTYENPDPVSTMSTQSLVISKTWVNELDGKAESPISINVLQDGEIFNTIELNTANGYEATSYIAVGIMTISDDGTVNILASGHDYSFGELGSDAYNWELVSDTVHPMLIDGVLTILYNRGTEVPEEGTYYKIGDYYYVVGTLENGIAKLTATNERRTYINISKDVEYDDPSFPTFDDELFEFTITVVDPNGDDVWFSVKESNSDDAAFITLDDGLEVEGATQESGSAYFFAKSGSAFIVRMKKGWNLRIINMLTGTIYSIEETNINEKFEFASATLTIETPDGNEEESFDDPAIEGEIETTNSKYSVLFTNHNVAIDITVTKEWTDGDNAEGTRPENITIKLLANDEEYGDAITITPDEDGNWSYTFNGLPIYDENGEVITYDLQEIEVPNYLSEIEKTNEGFTITNTLVKSITITKEWDDEGNEDSRPDTISIILLANGDLYETYDITADDDWTITIDYLPAYVDGQKITYDVDELSVDNYNSTKSGNEKNGFVITNTYEAKGTIEPPHTGIEVSNNVTINVNNLMLYISLIGLLYLKRKVYINL